MNVAGIFDGGRAGDVAGKKKARNIGADDFALANGGTGDFSIDGVADGDRFLNINAAIFGYFFTVRANSNSHVLTAGGGVFWNVDGETDIGGFTWSK